MNKFNPMSAGKPQFDAVRLKVQRQRQLLQNLRAKGVPCEKDEQLLAELLTSMTSIVKQRELALRGVSA